jgi:hypothetical protein
VVNVVTYAVISSPGSFFAEERRVKVDHCDPKRIKLGKYDFAIQFVEREEFVSKTGKLLTGEYVNVGPRYLIGEPYTKEDVLTKVDNNRILVSNMENNEWKLLVKCPAGNFQPVCENDQILRSNNE